MGRGALAILPAAPIRRRSRDSEYAYRQDSDFYYLTGLAEPEAVAVIVPFRAAGEYVIFCRARNPELERWEGDRIGPEGVVQQYGADQAYPISAIDEVLPKMLEGREHLFYTMGLHPDFDQRLLGWINGMRTQAKNGVRWPREIAGLDHPLHEMRLHKSRSELNALRASAEITMTAHRRAMRSAAAGLMEYQVAAEILHEFHHQGAVPSYSPIVGGGHNACVLHYRTNASQLNEGDLLLVDAGCEHDYYASDVTRTFPVGGRFSPEQRAVYEVVLTAQYAAIDACRPGNDWMAPHEAAVHAITRGLIKLGLLKGNVGKLIKSGEYREYFMHKTGHWLGMDVHDVGDYKVDDRWRLLEPGMVHTIEPGIYIAPGAKQAPKAFRGIGIRIEDDVAVTTGAPEVLTGDLVKEPDALEAFLQSSDATV